MIDAGSETTAPFGGRSRPKDGQTQTEAAYQALRADIIRGNRRPGERLRIERLRNLYGTGPTPLREALQRLSSERLVLAEGQRGFSVAPLDPAEFADINIARTSIEKEALRLSLQRGGDDWEARVVAAAYRLAKEDAALAASKEVGDRWERANAEFHTALVSACGSSWLLHIREGLHDVCERYRRASVYSRMGARDLHTEHAEISDAALARDIETACSLTERHFALTADSLRAGSEPE
ncbi:FCD domain-containing protein [Roseivivax marinus]|uniref:FCD domain-containing protein n=1 Tax=Roseivivax marinus TaxID=1379903 RepID=UPI001F044647|nr:FCD domain-containing protein [Roseivivax marinus]UMA64396.1 FCD domain-containing protein [Roseivivax marinus]